MRKIRNFAICYNQATYEMKKSVIFIAAVLAAFAGAFCASAESETSAKVGRVLRQSAGRYEAAVDSAIDIIADECMLDEAGFIEGESIIKGQIIPYMERHRAEVSLYEQSVVYSRYAVVVGQQGRNRFEETQRLNDKALALARQAGDYYMAGFVLDRKAIFEDMYGATDKAFGYYREAIANYMKARENTNRDIAISYTNMANIYLRIRDYAGMKQTIDAFSEYIAAADTTHRDFMLYDLYKIKGVYYNQLYDSAPEQERNRAWVDSLFRFNDAAISLLENSDDTMLRGYASPIWLYYNKAAALVDYYERPEVDSVEHYLNKMTENPPIYVRGELDFEIRASQQQIRADMWAKLGDFNRSKAILTSLIDEMGRQEMTTKDLIHNRIDLYKSLRDIAERTGHYQEGLAYADSLLKYQTAQLDNELRDAIKDSEVKYRTQETQLALAQSEAGRAIMLMWLFAVVGLLLVGAMVFVAYANRQRRRRMRREIEFSNLRADIGRQLTRQYVEGLENERGRMSRELHDGVCNDLLAIEMNMRNGTPPEESAALIDSCRESVRRISHELMPPEFAYATVDEVVRFYVNKQAEANAGKIGISYRSESESDCWQRVPDDVSLEIYRIVQEAVGNAVKHSGATQISVALTERDSVVEVEIADNGTFKSAARKGLGMDSIMKRARLAGGNVAISNEDGAGTRISVRIKI